VVVRLAIGLDGRPAWTGVARLFATWTGVRLDLGPVETQGRWVLDVRVPERPGFPDGESR
jgi:hypothetical protein